MMRRKLTSILAALILLFLCACGGGQGGPPVSSSSQQPRPSAAGTPSAASDVPSEQGNTSMSAASGEVVITFDYQKQSGYASNQFAVWIEDQDGNFVKTLYATRYTASGGYKNRPDSIPVWVERSGLAAMRESEVDAITGATPKAGSLSYTWDLTNASGGAVPPGGYQFFVEGSLRWKNRVLYIGTIEVGGEAVSAEAAADFVYEAAPDQPALTGDAPENTMIGTVTAEYIPEGQ